MISVVFGNKERKKSKNFRYVVLLKNIRYQMCGYGNK